jgi:hypothetical protein
MFRIVRFAEAVAQYVASGCTNVSSEDLADRLSVCEACEFRDGLFCGHDSCGCFLWLKARWKAEKCPATPSKWSEIACQK